MAEPFLGQVQIFGGNFAPRNWTFCNGQLLSISSNTALFSLLGTTYGGDGRTTFGLPDTRGRAPVGAGHGPGLTNRILGQKAGVENAPVSSAQMAAHNHGVTTSSPTLGAQSGDATSHEPTAGTVLAAPIVQGNPGLNIYSDQAADQNIEGAEIAGDLVLDDTGGGGSHPNMQPFLAMNYIIALAGLFPSRN